MKTIIPAQYFPVSLAEAKHQLAYFHSEDDEHVKALIAIATEEAEEYTGVTPLFKTVSETCAKFPAGMIVLKGLPFAKVNSVKYYDSDNTLQTLSASLYRVYAHNLDAQIEIIDSWPDSYDREDAVQVEYIIGHAGVTTITAATNLFTQEGHPFIDTDQVVVYKAVDGTIDSAIKERKVYYVVSSDADTFQLALTSGGAAIAIGADSTGQVYVGFSEAPKTMKQAIQMMLTGLNEFRQDEITGTMISKVSMSSRYLLDHVKPKRL